MAAQEVATRGCHWGRPRLASLHPTQLQRLGGEPHTPAPRQVTNTGAVDSDDVVLGFIVPPGAGVDGTPLQELFGFERVHVAAGQTVTVYLGAQGVRFTPAGVDGVRRALAGEYTVRFGVAETVAGGGGFAEVKVLAA